MKIAEITNPNVNWQVVASDEAAKKNAAYHERDLLVAALSKLFPSHLCRHPDSDTEWENDWRWIVCIHLPAGQATWHIHDSELIQFDHLKRLEGHWDGHTTEEKYVRLSQIEAQFPLLFVVRNA